MPRHAPRLDVSSTKCAETSLLREAITCAALGGAVAQTVCNVSSAAVTQVEAATSNLTVQFVALAQLTNVQNMTMERIVEITNGEQAPDESLFELQQQVQSITQEIDQTLKAMVVGLQFQDRHSQLLSNAAQMLGQFGHLLGDFREHSVLVQDDGISCEVAKFIAEDFLQHVRIGDVRQQFLSALREANILLTQENVSAESQRGTEELF